MKALLYSGGLDSACAFFILCKPFAFYAGGLNGPARTANVGEMTAIEMQREIAPEFAAKLRAVEIDFRPFMRPGKWQFQRDLLCCLAAWAAGFDEVSIAWCKDDGPTPESAAKVAKLQAAAVGFGFKVSFPLVHLTKAELVERALNAGAPIEFLYASHSCVKGVEPCNNCLNCKQRAKAFAANGIEAALV